MNQNMDKTILSKSEKYFVNELYELIISSAHDPFSMMEQLSKTLREFIGASEIILYECKHDGNSHSHEMLSNIRIDENEYNEYIEFAQLIHKASNSTIVEYHQKDGRIGEVLKHLNEEDVVNIPITANGEHIGCMHIFGTGKNEAMNQAVRLISSIRPLIGVVLQNYKLYNGMDMMLKERTEGLIKAREEIESLINTVPDLIMLTDEKLNIVSVYNYIPFRYYFSDIHEGENLSVNIDRAIIDEKRTYIESVNEGEMALFTEKIEVDRKINYLENRIKRSGDMYLHIIRNVSDYILAEKQIMFMSERDKLTGLLQRNKFKPQYNEYVKTADRIAIVLVDMNGLKLINETLGFSAGDTYLQILASTCIQLCPEPGSLFRAGDDEIAFVIPDINQKELESIIFKLNRQINLLNESSFAKFPLTLSTGTYIQENIGLGFEKAFNQAEGNLNQNKLLHSESKKSSIVKTLAKALEARDFITEGHAGRLEELLEEFGKRMGFDSSTVVKMRLLGKFHDIGKVGISDSILFKPGKLTEQEYEEMKKHSEIGYRIAVSAAELHMVAELILKHHERYDGFGYPIGLKGDEIPVECRILMIVDAYDAMTNNRPYRKAMSKQAAKDELVRFKGTQFDPELVDFFIKNFMSI